MTTERTSVKPPSGWLFREGDLAFVGDGPRVTSPHGRMLALSLDELPRELLFFNDADGAVLGSARVVDVDGGLEELDLADPVDLVDFHAHREVLYRCLGPRLRDEILRAIRTEIAVAREAKTKSDFALAEARRRFAVEALSSYKLRARARNADPGELGSTGER